MVTPKLLAHPLSLYPYQVAKSPMSVLDNTNKKMLCCTHWRGITGGNMDAGAFSYGKIVTG